MTVDDSEIFSLPQKSSLCSSSFHAVLPDKKKSRNQPSPKIVKVTQVPRGLFKSGLGSQLEANVAKARQLTMRDSMTSMFSRRALAANN
jgi:hypothetical protein